MNHYKMLKQTKQIIIKILISTLQLNKYKRNKIYKFKGFLAYFIANILSYSQQKMVSFL